MLRIIPPTKELQPFIGYYYTVRLEKGIDGRPIDELCLPSGYAFMGFQTEGNCYFILNHKKAVPSRFYTSGQLSCSYRVCGKSGVHSVIGAAIKPTGLWHLFGVDVLALTDKVIKSRGLFEDGLEIFTKKFDSHTDTDIRKQLIENLLLGRLQKVRPTLNMIDVAVDLIHENRGCTSIKHICEQLHVSERYFQKRFKAMVGLVPSVYNRIIRFNYLFAEMKADIPKDYKSIAALFNYYDFSHFSKDFKKYCGLSPTKFHVDKFHFLKEFMIDKPIGIPLLDNPPDF